jgi:hypothetical protein
MTYESEYWVFPDYCYMKTFSFQGGLVGIVFIDTVTLAPDGKYRKICIYIWKCIF